jgi:glycosyltransferase involved in cell wall biosynthesis
MKVAYYSPMPPSRSGIADYSALLLPELERRIDVAVAQPGRFKRAPVADVALYHIGNDSEAHGWIVEALRRRADAGSAAGKGGRRPGDRAAFGVPSVVVLHDYVLHHLVVGLTFARGDAAGYLAAMEREGGLVGRLLAYAVLDNKLPPLWETRPEDYPLTGEILKDASALIVHSRYVEDRVRALGYDGPIVRIPHPAWPVPSAAPAKVEGEPLFGCFGHLNETKRIEELVHAFTRVRERHPGARLLLVGSLAVRLARLELPEGVEHRDYVPEDELWSLMAACDAIVSLRSPTMGETSGSAIRALSLGKPLVVSDVGWFAELPGDAVIKVPVDEHEEDTLTAALEALTEPTVRAAMGAAALGLVEREHRVDRVAEAYAAALEELAGGPAVQQKVVHEVAQAAAEVGLEDTSDVARRLKEVGLGGG